MKRLLLVLIVFGVSLGSVGVTASTEPVKGFCLSGIKHAHAPVSGKCSRSYESGDHGTALCKLTPLTKQAVPKSPLSCLRQVSLSQSDTLPGATY